MDLVFASANSHKITEIQSLLGSTIRLSGLSDIGCVADIPETAPTLEGNAVQKARYVFSNYQLDCFSDDSGLEVDALSGRPGVLSARYAGPEKNADENMNKVLKELEGCEDRRASFRTVIALILSGEVHCFEGRLDGLILTEKRGKGGFGYDPIFQPIGSTQSLAEMTLSEKNQISHRAKAIQKLIGFLKASTV
jgi:XTP/dITP diphosphohydrolase